MLYGDFGVGFLTCSVSTIQEAIIDNGNLRVTFLAKRCYNGNYTTYLVVANEKSVPWIRKLKVGDHLVLYCYLNFIHNHKEERKASLTLSPIAMFVIDDGVHNRSDSIIIKK